MYVCIHIYIYIYIYIRVCLLYIYIYIYILFFLRSGKVPPLAVLARLRPQGSETGAGWGGGPRPWRARKGELDAKCPDSIDARVILYIQQPTFQKLTKAQ